jgi:hypothetical protein
VLFCAHTSTPKKTFLGSRRDSASDLELLA